MFGGHRHYVSATAACCLHHALEREVIGFCGAAGEHNFWCLCPDERRYLFPGPFHPYFGFPSETVGAAGRIAEFWPEIGEHRLQDPGVQRRRGVVIQVDGLLHGSSGFRSHSHPLKAALVGRATNSGYWFCPRFSRLCPNQRSLRILKSSSGNSSFPSITSCCWTTMITPTTMSSRCCRRSSS